MKKRTKKEYVIAVLMVMAWLIFLTRPAECQKIAVVGDYGVNNEAMMQVSRLVDSCGAEYVITTGDNFHKANTPLDSMVRKPYGKWFPKLSIPGKLFASMGNHDITDPVNYSVNANNYAVNYVEYFNWLPSPKRYYYKEIGEIGLGVINSDFAGNYSYCPGKNKVWERDGIDSNSIQGNFFRNAFRNSTKKFKIAVVHYPPYYNYPQPYSTATVNCDGQPYTLTIKNDTLAQRLRWKYAEMGCNAVLSGHTHLYERHEQQGIPFIISSLGGAPQGNWDTSGVMRQGTKYHFKGGYGATFMQVSGDSIIVETILANRDTIDRFVIYPQKSVRGSYSLEALNQPNGAKTDTIKVILRSPVLPYQAIDTSVAVVRNNTAFHIFEKADIGKPYLLQVRHRNSLSQWSAEPVKLGVQPVVFDWTNPDNVAGSSGILSGRKLSMYAGDSNQDGTIDGTDVALTDNAAQEYRQGYIPEDTNGSGLVDAEDIHIIETNVQHYPCEYRP